MGKNHRQKSTALKTVRQVLESAGLEPQPFEDGAGFTVLFKEGGPKVRGMAIVLEDEGKFVFYLEFMDLAPEGQRMAMAEFIARANYGISIGNFEMDFSNGGVRYKSSVEYSGADLPPIFVKNAILSAMDAAEMYNEGLISVMQGHKT